MKGQERVPTPAQLAEYAAKALFIEDMAMDANIGVAYLICKMSRLEINPVIVAIPSRHLASLAITYIQVAQGIRDAAEKVVRAQIAPGERLT